MLEFDRELHDIERDRHAHKSNDERMTCMSDEMNE